MNKIFYKLKLFFSSWLLRLGVQLDNPLLGLWSLLLLTVNFNRQSPIKVLCLGRSVFLDDIEAMLEFSGKIHYQMIRLSHFQIIFNQCRGGDRSTDLTEASYHTTNIAQAVKERYYCYLKKLVPLLHRRLGFQALLSGNFGYIVQQELARVFGELGLPVIVLHKEGVAMTNDMEIDMKVIANNRFIGSKILFYNDLVRELAINTPSIGVSRENSAVVGIPRLDYYLKKKAVNDKNQIVFFAFYPEHRFALYNDQEKVRNKILQRSEEFYKIVMDFAQRHPEIRVIIKTKSAQYYLDYVYDIMHKYFKKDLPNIEITNSGRIERLIFESKAVIGYNSTVLMEALLAGKIIFTPYFGDLITDREWDYFAAYPELVNYVKSLSGLEEYFFQAEKYKNYDFKRKEEYLSQHLPLPFGQASAKAEDLIIETIKSKQYGN